MAGVDTLDLGLYVRWNDQWPFLQARLEAWKSRAAGTDGQVMDDLGIGPVLMLAGGKAPMYRYHLQVPEFHLYLGKSDTYHQSPNVYVSLNAEALWRGMDGVVSLVWGLIEDLGGTVDKIQPSRVDLCADFLIPGGLSMEFLRDHMVNASALMMSAAAKLVASRRSGRLRFAPNAASSGHAGPKQSRSL